MPLSKQFRKLSGLLEKAIAIDVEAHRDQKDRFGSPYILHPLRVMSHVDSEAEKIVAILHDVVEDTKWTFEDLKREGFSADIRKALDCVTRREGESYDHFVGRSASNPVARRVKLADLEDNMDVRRRKKITQKDKKKLAQYLSAWHRLHDTKH